MNEPERASIGASRSWAQAYSDMIYWKFNGEPPAWSVASAVGFMERVLELAKGARVLDLGSALGHHAIELARRGYDVTGLEWSEAFLEIARRKAQEASVPACFIRGDMTCMGFDKEFDAVVLWGNTFAMWSDEENLRVLRGIKHALRPGGLALIDTQNYTTLPAKLEKGWDFHPQNRSLLMLTEGTRDVLKARFGFNVLALDLSTGRRHLMPFSWRLYMLPELRRIIVEAGLEILRIYGDDPKIVDWKSWQRGDPSPYTPEGYTENAAKRIVLCQA